MSQYKAKEIDVFVKIGKIMENLKKRRKYENKEMLRCTHSRRARF